MPYLKKYSLSFSDFIFQDIAKLALLLNAIEPRCGGVLFIGKKGTGKSTLLKAFKKIVSFLDYPFIEVPMSVTEEALLGGINIEETLNQGKRIYQRGLLGKAQGGFLLVEDINLFPNDILSLIFEVQSRGENIVEREGITLREPANFIILATMNLEEGEFSSHFLDRFGMCVIMDDIKDKERRKEIIRLNLQDFGNLRKDEEEIVKGILRSKELIKEVKLPDEIKDYIIELALKSAVAGHRADIFLMHAVKAYTAYLGEKEVKKEYVDEVAPLVLVHRKRLIEPPPPPQQEEEPQEEKEEQKQNQEKEKKETKQKEPLSSLPEGSIERFSQEKEEVFPVGESFKVKRILLKKDRIIREAVGRRTKTKIKGRGGRFVRSLIQEREEVAISATIRAASPFQIVRGRKDKLIIKEEDLRYKEKERKMRHIVIFVVDGSGSMGVENRMIQTKGAILSLLMDCYQKRDKIAMIVFRKDRAETVLPPTSSHELALKRLKEIPTGGKTPLSAGLMETYNLIRRLKLKEPYSRFLIFLITDGKANVSLTGKSVFEELQSLCSLLSSISSADFIVIDTEKKNKFIRMDIAFKVAEWLNARYYLVEDLKADSLLAIARAYKL
ncbi:VWA domain-containing protein [Thermodesulfobacterium sp. TA1]|uniref:VWA domain-containing protein n=1 Tax=Thermodesulfobacterium sp. TA1 TaxID=2234087 RepID=UPI0012329510|nr:VWA domain-containing protein [Thermodesulfobacterium sp. TA1]QER41769.1 VWA domain-containing protein [Thermodesulfobacterium sp. TA1]